ncbi:F-box domain-containing protein [Mycena indigotica]|uniref:F-box domain-containing protein n=1 Tax=Mycena indigotica TaxID=2126181 RepID=A0A8H6T6C4_9AGAR|nr:F-box domain-containing protein [Mycena indigotica]KAF7312598.1 F-box domain-containing protein [Mycena indigotica]
MPVSDPSTMPDRASRLARISQIDQELGRLHRERQTQLQSLAYPVLKLPVEITAQIFVHCVPRNALNCNLWRAAVVLGSVCRHWRAVVLSMSELWTAISLIVDGTASERISSSVALWLTRSKARPLAIRISPQSDAGDAFSDQAEEWWALVEEFMEHLLPQLVLHRARWQHVEISVPLSVLRSIRDKTEPLPELVHLSLGAVQEHWKNKEGEVPVTLFASAPQLQSLHLTLDTTGDFRRMGLIELPYGQLTSFTGTGFSHYECLEILDLMPNLVYCAFFVSNRDSDVADDPPPLERLRSLQLWSFAPTAHPQHILEDLVMPSLETLLVGRDDSRLLAVELSHLIKRSNCTIRHFACEELDPEDIADCLDVLTSIQTLDLLNYEQDVAVRVLRQLYAAITENSATQQRWKTLENITLMCRRQLHHDDFPFPLLVTLLEVLPVKRFQLVWNTALLPRPPTTIEVSELRRLGRQIYIGTPVFSWI